MGELLQRNASIASATDQTVSPCTSTITITDTGPDIYGTTSNVASGQVVIVAVNGTNYQATVNAAGNFEITGISAADAAAADGVQITVSTDDGAGCNPTQQFVFTECKATISVAVNGPDVSGTTTNIPAGNRVSISVNGTSYAGTVDSSGDWAITGISSTDAAADNGILIRANVDDGTGCAATTVFTYVGSDAFDNVFNIDCTNLIATGTWTQADWQTVFGMPASAVAYTPTNMQLMSTVIEDGVCRIRQEHIPTSSGTDNSIAPFNITAQTEISITQTIKLAPNFTWGTTSYSGKLGVGIGGGTMNTGGLAAETGYTMRLAWDAGGELTMYSYAWSDTQNFNANGYGRENQTGFYLPLDVDVVIEMWVKMNSSEAASDGEYKLIVDGVEVLHEQNVQFMADGTPEISRLQWSEKHGGGDGWQPTSDTYALISDISWE